MAWNFLAIWAIICFSRTLLRGDNYIFLYSQGIFLFSTASRPALGPTQPTIQWVPGAISLGVKRPGCEADHSPPSSAEVKNAWSYTSTPQYAFMTWCLVKHRDNFTLLYFTLQGKLYLYLLYSQGDQRKENGICDTYNIHGEMWIAYKILIQKP
jgi:hypothetical protein